jgi:hypothetical protein
MKKSEDISVPEKMLADFKAINEDWNMFELEDGTILKIKLVIVNVFKERSGEGFKAVMQAQNVLGTFSPDYLRGEPSKRYTREELAKSIDKNDIDVIKVIQQPWNEYNVDDTFSIKTKVIPVQIARTSKYDNEGMPVYLVETTAIVKGKPLKKSKQTKKK